MHAGVVGSGDLFGPPSRSLSRLFGVTVMVYVRRSGHSAKAWMGVTGCHAPGKNGRLAGTSGALLITRTDIIS